MGPLWPEWCFSCLKVTDAVAVDWVGIEEGNEWRGNLLILPLSPKSSITYSISQDIPYCFLNFLLLFFLDEGYYQSGKFQFEIDVPEAYNMVVSSPASSLTTHPHFLIFNLQSVDLS